MESDTALYGMLTAEARELYDYVSDRYPAWEHSGSPFGTDRAGSRRDDAFRNLLRGAVQGTAEPTRWQSTAWPDSAVATAASDPDVRRQAWANLTSEDPNGWTSRWVGRNRNDRLGTYAILGVIAVVVAAVALKSILPILVVFTALAIYRAVVEARKDAHERKGTTSGP